MKKKIVGLLAFILCATIVFAACSSYPTVKVEGVPEDKYAVVGNGGGSVQVGKYIYFVNGYEDYVDDGTTNKWGDVVRGGIYRVEIVDGQDKVIKADTDVYKGLYGEYTTLEGKDAVLDENVSGLKMKTVKNYDDEDVQQVDVVPIVNKKVTNGGYDNGGIYVYEGWIYYCSPVSGKDKAGNVLYDLTEFYRTRLNGKDTQLLYTTADKTVKASYGYYRQDGKTYLVVKDGTNLVSVACGEKKTSKPVTMAENVTSAMFSNKPVYHRGMDEMSMTAEDFVYFTRAVVTTGENADKDPNGNVLERVLPSGDKDSRNILFNNSKTITLQGLRNGYLYYSQKDAAGLENALYATDLASVPVKDEEVSGGKLDEVQIVSNIAELTNIYVNSEVVSYEKEKETDTVKKLNVQHYVIATRNGNTVKIVYPNSDTETVLMTGVAAVVKSFASKHEFYYTTSTEATGDIYRADVTLEKQTGVKMNETAAQLTGFFAPERTAGYFFYSSTVNEVIFVEDTANEKPKTTTGYMMVKRDIGYQDEKEFLCAVFAEKDIPEEDEVEEE